jgi:hypothetical protein
MYRHRGEEPIRESECQRHGYRRENKHASEKRQNIAILDEIWCTIFGPPLGSEEPPAERREWVSCTRFCELVGNSHTA